MDMKRLAIGTIVGGVTYYVVGYLIFQLSVADFYAANRPPGFYREEPIFWAVAVGSLGLGLLLTLAITSREGALTIAGGVVTGALYNFLVWFGVDFVHHGGQEAQNLTLAIVDPLLEVVRGGVTGAVLAAVLARVPKGVAVRPAE
jgi:hypothetical protein